VRRRLFLARHPGPCGHSSYAFTAYPFHYYLCTVGKADYYQISNTGRLRLYLRMHFVLLLGDLLAVRRMRLTSSIPSTASRYVGVAVPEAHIKVRHALPVYPLPVLVPELRHLSRQVYRSMGNAETRLLWGIPLLDVSDMWVRRWSGLIAGGMGGLLVGWAD
jgi:hypothetical protein